MQQNNQVKQGKSKVICGLAVRKAATFAGSCGTAISFVLLQDVTTMPKSTGAIIFNERNFMFNNFRLRSAPCVSDLLRKRYAGMN